MTWDIKQDQISITGKETTMFEIYTKRQILNKIAAVFHSLVFFIPVLLKTKLLLKELLLKNLDWVEKINKKQIDSRKNIQDDLKQIKNMRLLRFIVTDQC